jgi:hypothetical protein
VALELKFTAIATLQSLRQSRALSVFGGAIVTMAGRDDITTLADLRDKRVSSVSLSSHGGHQMQALEVLYSGVNLFTDAKQVRVHVGKFHQFASCVTCGL